MFASSFAILGIGPTNDQKIIRRAYATALKRIDQAADPEGFAALRGAYEHARAWAEHQPEGNVAFTGAGNWPAGDEQPQDLSTQASPGIFRPSEPTAPESSVCDAPSNREQESAEREADRAQATHAWSDAAPQVECPDEPPLRSRVDLDEGVAYWTERLMHTSDAELAQELASALADERLGHLEARGALARSLAMAMREQPDGRLALFNNARRVFDWNGLDAPIPQDPDLSGWVLMLLDQIERYSHLPLPLRVRLDAVVMLARRRSVPNVAQALWHGQNFELLLLYAPDLSLLDLGQERIRSWSHATKRFVVPAFDWRKWLSDNSMKLAVIMVCLLGLAFIYQDTRDGTTYRKEQPSRASLLAGHVTLLAHRVAADPQPCAQRAMLAPPLGCPTLELNQAAPESWPTATPKVPVITAQPSLPYPQDARVRAIKGLVLVRVMLDTQGKVQRKAVMISSGNSALDQAAVDAAGNVRMMPATEGGVAVPGQAVLAFNYQLEKP